MSCLRLEPVSDLRLYGISESGPEQHCNNSLLFSTYFKNDRPQNVRVAVWQKGIQSQGGGGMPHDEPTESVAKITAQNHRQLANV